jgi:multimeric flavodoxin WrbA
MKIICLLGSPRLQGNSTTIARRFLDTAQKMGAEVQTFVLHQLDFRGCTSCNACKNKLDRCRAKDDLTPVLEALYETDVLVITTPVYFSGPNYKVCSLLERTYSYFAADWTCRLPPGKKLVYIQAQSQPKNEHKDAYSRYDQHFQRLGFGDQDRYFIHAFAVDRPDDIKTRDDILQLAEETARKVCA